VSGILRAWHHRGADSDELATVAPTPQPQSSAADRERTARWWAIARDAVIHRGRDGVVHLHWRNRSTSAASVPAAIDRMLEQLDEARR